MYYFKTKHRVKRGTLGYVDVWRFTGIISPYKNDSIVMTTTKSTDAIHHTDGDIEMVKRVLTRRGYTWKVYNAKTNEIIDDQNSLICI